MVMMEQQELQGQMVMMVRMVPKVFKEQQEQQEQMVMMVRMVPKVFKEQQELQEQMVMMEQEASLHNKPQTLQVIMKRRVLPQHNQMLF